MLSTTNSSVKRRHSPSQLAVALAELRQLIVAPAFQPALWLSVLATVAWRTGARTLCPESSPLRVGGSQKPTLKVSPRSWPQNRHNKRQSQVPSQKFPMRPRIIILTIIITKHQAVVLIIITTTIVEHPMVVLVIVTIIIIIVLEMEQRLKPNLCYKTTLVVVKDQR